MLDVAAGLVQREPGQMWARMSVRTLVQMSARHHFAAAHQQVSRKASSSVSLRDLSVCGDECAWEEEPGRE